MSDVKAVRFDRATDARRDVFRRLLDQYSDTFEVIGRARRCGLDWQRTYDGFMMQLERRHGMDMDTGNRDVPSGIVRNRAQGALHDGSQGGPLSECPAVADRLASLRLPPLPESLALRPGERSGVRGRLRRGPNDDLILSPQSAFAQSIYKQAITSDRFKLLVARETLWIAGDDEGALALDRYLERVALSTLLQEQVPSVGTVEQLIGNGPGIDGAMARDMRLKALAASLRPRIAQSSGSECDRSPYSGMQKACKYVGHSAWVGYSPEPYWVYLRLMIENASGSAISQFVASLQVIPAGGGEPLKLSCATSSRTEGGLVPGQQWEYFCRETIQAVPIEKLLSAVQAAEKDPSQMSLDVTHINFTQPPIYVNREETGWLNRVEASREAMAAMRGASCFARGSCIDEVKHRYSHNPWWPAGTAGFVVGMLAGCLIRLFWKRQRAAASILSIVAVLGIAALWLGPLFGYGPFAGSFGGLFVAQLASAGLLFLVAGLWGTLAVVNILRPRVEHVAS